MTLLLAKLLDFLESIMGIRRHRTHFYDAYIHSPAWDRRRRAAIRAAGNRCENCGRGERVLQVHHKHYKTLGHERPQDLEVLCLDCHPIADAARKWNNRARRVYRR